MPFSWWSRDDFELSQKVFCDGFMLFGNVSTITKKHFSCSEIRYIDFFVVLDLITKFFRLQCCHYCHCLPLPTYCRKLSTMIFSLGPFMVTHPASQLFLHNEVLLRGAYYGCTKYAFSSSTLKIFLWYRASLVNGVVKRGTTTKKCHELGKLLKKAKADGLIEPFVATLVDEPANS